LPARSPNLNAYAERWVRSVKEECLSKLILLGEGSLRRVLRHYQAHYHQERNHQGKDNLLLFPLRTPAVPGTIQVLTRPPAETDDHLSRRHRGRRDTTKTTPR
jgi:hypothetical protein